jgi:hypothetical protein
LKLFTRLFILVLITSCSSKWHDYFLEEEDHGSRNEKLMESFEVEEDVLEKFQVEKKEEPAPVKKEVPKKVTKKSPEKRKDIRPKPDKIKKLTKKPKKKKAPKKKIEVKKKVSLLKEKKYPSEFPEKLKNLDNLTAKFWKQFTPKIYPGEKIYMDINYMGISTGKIVLSANGATEIAGKNAHFVNAKVKTAAYYRYLYELDDNVDSYIDIEGFRPIKYSLIQRESGQNIDDLQLYDNDKMMTYSFYKRVTKKKTKKKKGKEFIPKRFQDPLSILYFLRGLPMKVGDHYQVPVINKGKVIMFNTKVEKIEEIKTKIGKKQAIRMRASTKYSGETLKSGDMTFWFSNDERRVFLRFKAKIKIGSVSGDIEKYQR